MNQYLILVHHEHAEPYAIGPFESRIAANEYCGLFLLHDCEDVLETEIIRLTEKLARFKR